MSTSNTLVCPMSTPQLTQRILSFIEYVAQLDFYSYQRVNALRIIESLLLNDGDVITSLFSRQSGKSNMMAAVALGLTIIMPVLARTFPEDERLARLSQIRIGIFGPNQDSTGPIYERMRQMGESEHVKQVTQDPEINIHLVQSRGDSLTWSLGSYVKAKTASENAFVEGGTYHLIIIDEAQKVSSPKVRKEIAPMLASTNGTMVKIGTAWMSRGGFHSDIQTNILIERQGGKKNHFEFDYEVVIREKRVTYNRQKASYDKYRQQLADLRSGARKAPPDEGLRALPPDGAHLNYEKWVNGEIKRIGGTNSEEFRMNFKLAWQESRQIALTDDEIVVCGMPNVEASIECRRGTIVAGLDVAKSSDSSVLTITDIDFSVPVHEEDRTKTIAAPAAIHYVKTILTWVELQGSFEKVQYNAIVDTCCRFAVSKLVIDSTGIGDPVAERLGVLLAPLDIEVETFRFTTQSKSDLYKFYLQEFKARRVRYPAGPKTQETHEFRNFIEQHGDLTREWNGSYLVCQASEESLHDDYPDSAALSVHASRSMITARELPAMEVSSGGIVGGTRYGGAQSSGGRSDRYRRSR